MAAPAAPPNQVRRITRPTVRDFDHKTRRMDNCLHWAKRCGQEAANWYCVRHGYKRAQGFGVERYQPTFVALAGRRCEGPGCIAFSYIDCVT